MYTYFETDKAVYHVSNGKHYKHLKEWGSIPGFKYHAVEIGIAEYMRAYHTAEKERKNMKWTDNLKADVFGRLRECHSLKSDIESLVAAKWSAMVEDGKDKAGFTKEDALVFVLELLDCNGQCFDLTQDEYNSLIR